MRRGYEVAHVLQGLGKAIGTIGLNTWQLRTLSAIRDCRTAALGGHVDACTECGTLRVSYNSCRNRHCPKCQGNKREEWIQARNSELLPLPYFHVVFTLPSELNVLCLQFAKQVYRILFKSAWATLDSFGISKGVKTGMIAVLHTWGQNLCLHPHLHCIVPGGGIDKNGKWRNIRSDGKFLFPVKALSKVFRAKYVALLRNENIPGKSLLNTLFTQPWVVYAKRPFAHPSHVIEYLGRYTHKVAISNNRITNYADAKVTFTYKDYRHGSVVRSMTMDDKEFIRRFALHILPRGFVRIRHYGILSSSAKIKTIPQIREQLPDNGITHIEPRRLENYDPVICPCCGKPAMVTVEVIPARGPPQCYPIQVISIAMSAY